MTESSYTNHGIRLDSIPETEFNDYRYQVIFNAYKWDPQVSDHPTIAKHVVILSRKTADQLEQWAEKLTEETIHSEEILLKSPKSLSSQGLPKAVLRRFPCPYDSNRHVRLMRFDFHPITTDEGWAVSEVNSDVPGGLAEAAILPRLCAQYFDNILPSKNIANIILDAFRPLIKPNDVFALIHATSYSDDRQVVQFLGDAFKSNGYNAICVAPDHLQWNRATHSCAIYNPPNHIPINAIVRFFPAEWLRNLAFFSNWQQFFLTQIPSCNHPAAVLSQSKRLPLLWEALGLEFPTWKKLLPPIADPKIKRTLEPSWIWKPALGRVGADITIQGTLSDKERQQIEKAVRKRPSEWIAQKLFQSFPLAAPDGTAWHLCVGVFTVNGKSAGFYGRISQQPRIDETAKDIPILIQGDMTHDRQH